MMSRVVAILGVVLVVAGCSVRETEKASAFVDGTSVHSISVGGLERTYRLYQPTGLPAAAPLVVMLHGGFGNGAQAERAYGWDQLADSSKFVVAYPDGLNRAWNVTGISNGGIMSYTLACNTGVFAAIGPGSATQPDPCRSPRLTSVMHIHGTADRLIRYDGGPGAGVAHIDGPPVPELNAFWRNADQCGAPAVKTSGPVATSTARCADNRSVVLVTVDGGGHQWPSFATQKLWEFFTAHPR